MGNVKHGDDTKGKIVIKSWGTSNMVMISHQRKIVIESWGTSNMVMIALT
jgi:hypothetical protein